MDSTELQSGIYVGSKVLLILIIKYLNKMLFNHYTMTSISVPRHTALMTKMLNLTIISYIVIIEYQVEIVQKVLAALLLQCTIQFYKVTHC